MLEKFRSEIKSKLKNTTVTRDKMRVLFVVYDNGSYITWFPQGISYVAAVLRQEGVDVEIYHQDMNHYPDEHLEHYLNNNPKYDMVGISVIGGYWQYQRLMGLSRSIERTTNRPDIYIIGGYGPSPEPEYFLKKTNADICVMGEGEETTREIVRAYMNNEPLDTIAGTAYRDGDQVKINARRPLIAENLMDDQSVIPLPAYDLFPMHYYRLLRMPHADNYDFCQPVLSGRGCTFKCNFCYRMDTGFRPRSAEAIIEEIEWLKRDFGITYVAFSDDLLMVSEKRTVELMEAFIKSDLNIKFDCNGRLNYAKPEVLKLMKRAGAVYINYGIEAYDNQILKNMKKGLNTKMIDKGIEETLKLGITPGLNIIWGNIGENVDTLRSGVDFLKKHSDGTEMRTIRPVTPYPGSPLYFHGIKEGLIDKDNPAEDFYERLHVNSDLMAVNFTDLSEDQFYEAICAANKELIEDHFTKNINSYKNQTDRLYLERDDTFRGYRQT